MENIKMLDNGVMEVAVSFDVTKHDHSFSTPRNYDISQYTDMVNCEDTQNNIKRGYAIGFYSHKSRNTGGGYIASERDDDGNEVEPVCKTVAMSINGNIVSHTQHILPTAKGEMVKKLILASVGGFSSVHNLKDKKFFSFDFVLSPNFNGNRVIVDSICANGSCKLDSSLDDVVLDAIGLNASDEIREIAMDLLKNSQDVQDTITITKYMKQMSTELLDTKEDNKKLQIELDSINDYKQTVSENLSELNSIIDNNRDESNELRDKYNTKLDEIDRLKMQLDSLGILVKYDGTLVQEPDNKMTLDDLFSNGDIVKEIKLDFDSIDRIHIKTPPKTIKKRPFMPLSSGLL